MKIKSLIVSSLAIVVVLIITGCGSTQLGTPSNIKTITGHPESSSSDLDIYLVGTHNNSSNSISRASDIEESAYLTIQHAAMQTLKRGNKYFAVNAPKAMSNFNGSTIITMEEYIDKCGTSALGGFGSAFDKFGTNSYYCNISGVDIVHTGFMEVAFFKERPHNILVWDAQATIDYLKEEGLYQEYDKGDLKTIGSAYIGGGGYWLRNYREAK